MTRSLEGITSMRTSVTERNTDFARAKFSEVEQRKRKLDAAAWEVVYRRESLERGERELEERKRDFFLFEERRMRELAREEEELSLDRARFLEPVRMDEEELRRGVAEVRERVKGLVAERARVREMRRLASERSKEIEADRESLRLERESWAERKNKAAVTIGGLNARFTAVEEKEEGFRLKKESLNKKEEEFAEKVRVWEQGMLQHRFMERIESAELKLEGVRVKINERFEEIECSENAGYESLALNLTEADLIRESVEKKLEELEKAEAGFTSFREEKNRELASEEELREMTTAKLIKDVQLMNEQLIEREELGHRLLERLELAKDDVEGMTRSCDEKFQEICLKIRELASKEQLLDVRSKEVFREAELRNEELIEREKLGHLLLERLELAKDTVEGLSRTVLGKYREIGFKETELVSLRDWVEKKLDVADLKAREYEEREWKIAEKEAHLISKETELQERENYFRAWQEELKDERKEVDLSRKANEEKLKNLDIREKNLNSVREFTRNCFKEHLAIKRKYRAKKDLVEKRATELDLKEQHLNNALKDIELREKQVEDSEKLLEKQHSPRIFNTPLMIEPDGSADLKFMVRMDGKTLQMFVNDADKDMKTMGDEIFKVLHLSSDPAKLVLDAMEGFYPPHLRKEDVGFNVRRTCITLLEQLSKMSPEIKPNVREDAIKVATSWKSKLGACVQTARSLEVLGFLFLLSAFDLVSYFDCDEVASLVMMVDQHRETAELLYGLGSEMSTEGSF